MHAECEMYTSLASSKYRKQITKPKRQYQIMENTRQQKKKTNFN